MPSGNNTYAFCADYSEISVCLFAIQASEASGTFAGDAQLLKLLRQFETDVLKKLYLRTVRVLGIINGNVVDLQGDFEDADFLYLDFHVGYLDGRNTSYSSTFKTILNIFRDFCKRSAEISEADKFSIVAALVPVLDAFEILKRHLEEVGLNPCDATETAYINNSANVYLQVAGADGTAGVAKGLHLRWTFTGEMGENHLPKGSYDNSGSHTGYNQPNDFVRIYRTAYLTPVRVTVDFENDRPVVDFVNKRWTYFYNQTVNNKSLSSRVRLTFTDPVAYTQLAANLNPGTFYFDFLKQYPGVVEIELLGKSAFCAAFEFTNSGASQPTILKLELFSQAVTSAVIDDEAEGTEYIITRKTALAAVGVVETVSVTAENIRRIQMKKSPAGFVRKLYLESYHDFLETRSPADWTQVGNGFALSFNDTEVYSRLETAAYAINNLWPQYNNGTKVKVANYQNKWSVSSVAEPSVKSAVQTYLELSETDPRAEDVIFQEGAGPEDPGILVSYLDLLNFQATDFHFARMFGLGHIDVIPGVLPANLYVYQLRYTNRKSLTDAQPLSYIYTSLPTAITDFRLPAKPGIRSVKYGLPVNDEQVNTIFDASGYTKIDNIRAVNIGRSLFSDELDHDFFADLSATENLNVFQSPKPVLYGIEYRPSGQSAYVKPEITRQGSLGTVYYAYDTDFPSTGVPETIPVPDEETSLYIHFEKQTGVHYYAIYGINWFSRASVLSDEVATDATAFPLANVLSPPADLAVQYLQKEDVLVFTSSREQTWLAGRTSTFPGQDIGLTRITFSYVDILDISRYETPTALQLTAMPRPNKANLFFNPALPLEISGVIRNILPVSGAENQLRLFCGSYQTLDGTLVSPVIASADFFRFAGSLLNTIDGQFQVINIEAGVQFPVITVEKISETLTVTNEEAPGGYDLQKNFKSPEINSRFSLMENMTSPANWQPLAKNISLISFASASSPVLESSVDAEGNISKLWIGGISGSAVVTPLFHSPLQTNDLPGYYQVTFVPAVVLSPHPQINLPFDPALPNKNAPGTLREAHVEWYKGWLRMPVAGTADKKLLEVQSIAQGTNLVLHAYDASFAEAPIIHSANATDYINSNFHPGYRAYLFPEPPPVNQFNRDKILPLEQANDKRTLLGIQSADLRAGGSGFASPVSLPAVLLARNIQEPVQMQAPVIPGLKVRPDATGKAAFTFDMAIPKTAGGQLRKPFGFMFYRTTTEDVLDALYAPATVVQIHNALTSRTVDEFYNLRFAELVNLIFDPGNPMHFKVFAAQPNPYGFPVPDKAGLVLPGDNATTQLAKYKAAIQGTLLPLSEQLPVYDYIRNGLQTENVLPVIRDIDSNLLNPADPKFNPFPMARKYITSGTEYVRFTDYSLNGSSRNLYFYAGTESNSQLVTGVLSVFAGPVSILQTLAADPPVVRSFSIVPPVVAGDNLSVVFHISPFPSAEAITKVRIYRTTDPLKAGYLQQMDLVTDVLIDPASLLGYDIADTFEDLAVIPAGQTVYYRLAGIRMISNEQNLPEEVISHGSEGVPVRLIDTVNPVAPVLSYNQALNRLSWQQTTFGGLYYVYRQNSRGNWERLATVTPANEQAPLTYTLPGPLNPLDEDGNQVYYRFKVQVQNSSGLLNLSDKELTI